MSESDPTTTTIDDLNPFQTCESFEELLGNAAGATSMCWTNVRGAGAFDADKAYWVTQMVTERMNQLVRAERARAWAEGATAALDHTGLAPVDEGPVNPYLG